MLNPKVLHLVSPTGYYGAERWIVALVRNIDEQRIVCDVAVTIEGDRDELEIVRRISETSASLHKLHMASRFDLSVVQRLAEVVNEGGYDVVHSHGYKSDILALLVKRRCNSLKIISTPHGFGEGVDCKLRVFHYLGLRALRYFDAVAPLSPQLVNRMRAASISEDKIKLIANGVDLTDMPLQVKSAKKNSGAFKVGFIGRLVSGKQVDHLLLAFNEFWLENNNASLDIVGEGMEYAQLVTLSSRLESRDCIRFHGYVEDRFSIMNEFDVIVLPSKSEGIPRSLMEAMAMNIPVVAYDIDGVNMLIEHNLSGVLCELDNKKSITNALHKLCLNISFRDQIVEDARQRVEMYFSAAAMAVKYEKLYCDVVHC